MTGWWNFKGSRIVYDVYEIALNRGWHPGNISIRLKDAAGNSIEPPLQLEEYFVWKSTGELRGYKL